MAVSPVSSGLAAQPTTSTNATNSSSASSANNLANLNQNTFMNLLVTQMQYQNPLDPVSSTDFINQLAQFSTLSSMQTLNSNFTQMISLQQMAQGSNLIGKQITFSVAGKQLPGNGVVTSLQVNNGTVNLMVGNQSVALSQVQTIQAAS